jgi:hypothetical protein
MGQAGTFRRIPDPTIKKKPAIPTIIEPLDSETYFEDEPKDTRPSTIIPHNPTAKALPALLLPVIGIIVGLVLLAFGIFNAGGFYEQGSRLSGGLATFFYVWQIGNLLEIVGVIVVWECLKKIKATRERS